ncbi:unannotated protein [freshwater metagenome]|uniref:Unannotated protein n=1 Tax=freshwater metagenome TaxID=449393 RepID=A0A6J7G8J7_9ZZZZ
MLGDEPESPLAGIGHGDIEPAESIDGELCGGRNIGFDGDVAADGIGTVAARRSDGPQARFVDIGEHHRGAFGEEVGGDGLTDAAGRAGDERDLAQESCGHAEILGGPGAAPGSALRRSLPRLVRGRVSTTKTARGAINAGRCSRQN